MAAKTIPEEVRQRAIDELTRLAQHHGRQIAVRHRGRFLYIDKAEYGRVGPLCRLEYRGSPTEWGFAIYKYPPVPGESLLPAGTLAGSGIPGRGL